MDDIKNRNVESDGMEENYSDFTRAVNGITKSDSGDDGDKSGMGKALKMGEPEASELDDEVNNNIMQTKEYWEEFTKGIGGILGPDNNIMAQ